MSATPVPDVDLEAVSSVYQVYPKGTYPVQIGSLSLGAPRSNQTYTKITGNTTEEVKATYFNSYLYTSEDDHSIPSYSYGMHIGSVAFNIPGSAMLGGYDQSRVIGDVTSQSYVDDTFAIELLDVDWSCQRLLSHGRGTPTKPVF